MTPDETRETWDSGENSRYGFTWGPAAVERHSTFDRAGGRYRCIGVKTPGSELHIWVSPTGRSVRVFRGAVEMKPAAAVRVDGAQ